MGEAEREPVVLDTSVLINFLAVDRMDLLAAHPGLRFLITEHVRGEVRAHYRQQVERLDRALEASVLEQVRVDAVEELHTFARLTQSGRLGAGECAAIAAAGHRCLRLAIDDKAARKAALEIFPALTILDTQAVVLSLVRAGTMGLDQADGMKDAWARDHSFRLKIASFRELL